MTTSRRGRPRAANQGNDRGNDAAANEAAEREAAEREAREADEADESEDGEHEAGDAPDEDAEADFAAVNRTDHDAHDPQGVYHDQETGDGLAIGSALTARQQAGIDPVDEERHVEQAADRRDLTNAQTDHERENALDAVSGTANTGITENHGHSAPGKLGASDMSGRKPVRDPLAGAGAEMRSAMGKLREASRKATSDRKRGHGYLNLRELGVSKATMDALHAEGHVTRETRPGGTFNPETGVVYRVAGHVEPDVPAKEDA